jgi:predicted GNAT family acetyltransferase
MFYLENDPARFLQRARTFLEEFETENNLLLGISSWLVAHSELIEQPPYFITVEENGKVRAAAMMTPPHNLVLTRAKRDVLVEIADQILTKEIHLPGVNGPTEASQTFTEVWTEKTGRPFRAHRSLRLYELRQVIPQPTINGRLRLAHDSDASTLKDWIYNFNADIQEPQTEEEASKTFQRLVTDRRLYVWEDKDLCSIAAWGGPTTHGTRISLVYTPPELRQKGYATACVATLSQSMLESGKKFCCLFADLTNPTSNRLHQRIGYGQVCDFTEYRV